ncbi:hypothetical protein RHSIM_Rhsim02G0232100 [Rhododendron simsii]|uniref:Uncharacterized protein n=1 Tax=Rhododendron simsii TaxID=118357 RepID=A0A834HC50_RHOSS|nr:hypothetical protein RHSIM_Rhsim02G0232100 [Rhododendron simsii]
MYTSFAGMSAYAAWYLPHTSIWEHNDDTCLAYTLAAICNLFSEVGISGTSRILESSNSPGTPIGTSLSIQQQLLVLLRRSLKRAESLKLKRLVAWNHVSMAKFYLMGLGLSSSDVYREFSSENSTMIIEGAFSTAWLKNFQKSTSLQFSPKIMDREANLMLFISVHYKVLFLGTCINPARSLGAAVVFNRDHAWTLHWSCSGCPLPPDCYQSPSFHIQGLISLMNIGKYFVKSVPQSPPTRNRGPTATYRAFGFVSRNDTGDWFGFLANKAEQQQMWILGRKGSSGFSACSTAEEVTQGIDGTGLTSIVTGASSGIGKETTRVLALRGVHVVMAVRNTDHGTIVKEAILKENPIAKIDVMELDVSSMASVRKFASEYTSSGLPLNLLINNAGVNAPFALTEDNIELMFGTNHIGHFLLTNLLFETMKRTAHESQREGRIVIVASEGHRFVPRGGIRFDKINDESCFNITSKIICWEGYDMVCWVFFLPTTKQEEGVGLTCNSLDPGPVATDIMRHHSIVNGLVNMFIKYLVKNIPQGAATTCYVALHPRVKGVNGEYFCNSNIGKRTALA